MNRLQLLGAAVLVSTALAGVSSSALADTAPPDAGTPSTVSADGLPTVQIDGVVWSQVTIGTTVYATGRFAYARPAGSAPGSNRTTRSNLLAYSLTTGNLLPFDHRLNGQGLAIAASPDGRKLFVGGDFTQVDGLPHGRVAAFDVASASLISGFAVTANSSVKALAATENSLYLGGTFTTVNGAARTRLAEVSLTGALRSWAPVADSTVKALVATPDRSRVIVGGHFAKLNATTVRGLGAVLAADGSTQPWAANTIVWDSGANAAITSLRTDGHKIYGTGFNYHGGGILEGAFAAEPNSGQLVWVEDCHGDSYDTFPIGSVLYLVGHPHFCGNVGGYPNTTPARRALAFTTAATGTLAHNQDGYHDYGGQPTPTLLHWYPNLVAGTFTGQNQAAWSVTGNSDYIALGGEFPSVNGVAQQGLVRFAVRGLAPNQRGPQRIGALKPVITSPASGSLHIQWQGTYDDDNTLLTYDLVRDGNVGAPIYTTSVRSNFWTKPTMSRDDTGLVRGSTHTYVVYVRDRFNPAVAGAATSATVS